MTVDVRAEREEQTSRQAREAYANHEIREESDGRWVLQRRYAEGGWRSEFWVEIIALHGGGLLVDGDTDPVVFRYGPADAEARVRWMGERRAAHDHYVREKASIGSGLTMDRWDSDVARADLRELEAELRHEADSEDEGTEGPADVAAEALPYVDDGPHEVRRILYEGGVDPECWEHVGQVTANRLYYAHAALARLCELLDARKADGAKSGRGTHA